MLVVNSETATDMDFMLLTSYGHNLVSLIGDEVFEDQQPNTQDIWEKFEVLDNCPMNEFFPLSPLLPSLKTDYHDPILDMFDNKTLSENKVSRPSEIRNHDCMWAGHCASKDHETPQKLKYKNQNTCHQTNSTQQSNQSQQNRRCNSNIQQTTSGRSLLINSKNNQQIKNNIRHDHSFSKGPNQKVSTTNGVNVQHYETPEVSSEDDSMDCNPQLQQIVDFITSEKQTVMQILNEALSNTEADLTDYLHDHLEEHLENSEKKQTNGDGDNDDEESSASSVSSGSESEESESEECDIPAIQTPPASMKKKNIKNDMVTSIMPDHSYHLSAESDHCYHISKESSKRFENLGVDTPSDSEEEEIDVVNVYGSETHHQMLRQYHQKAPLPTNPSLYDRQTLQRSVATAINKRRRTIKTRLPNHNNRTGTTTPTTTVPTSQNEYMQQSGSQPSITTNHNNSGTNCSSYNSSRNIKDQHNPPNTISPPPTPQASSPPQRVNKKRGATDNLQKGTSTQSTSKGVKRARRSYRQRRKRGSGDSSDSDSDKRSLHNDMERQRRVDLRNAFDDLRVLLPSVCNKERAAKVNILRDAAEYCHEISRLEPNLHQQKLELKRHQLELKARVSYLRRLLASKR